MKKIFFTAFFIFLALNHAPAEKIPFDYRTSIRETTLPAEWNESWFGEKSSYEYHHGIARIACLLSAIAYTPETLKTNYRKLGFTDNDISMHYDVDYSNFLWGNDQCAFSIASKTIGSINDKRTLVIVNIRGTPLSANEWLSNLNINDSSQTEEIIHRGFGKAASIIHTALISYLLRGKIDPTDSFILITGHSRGGAVSNLLARTLHDDGFFKRENTYAYTFASPNVTTATEALDAEFGYIWNIVNAEDIVPTLPFFRNNWHFMKYGRTVALSNYTSTDQNFYVNELIPKINVLYESFFGRDYCPFYTGPFIPIYITRIASHYIGNVEKFYRGFSGLHGKAVELMQKIFPAMEDEINKKKNSRKSKIIERLRIRLDEKREGFSDYITKAFTDMHQVETYLSYLLATDENETYSDSPYTIVAVEGTIEAAVLDEEKNVYLEAIEGLTGIEYQRLPAVALPSGGKQLLIGVPGNMELELFLTDNTVLLSPAKVWLEHFNAAGIYLCSTERQLIYLNMHTGSKFKIGKEILGQKGVREEKVHYKERKNFVEIASLKPEHQVRFYPEFSFGTDCNLTAGINYGIPVFYGCALISWNALDFKKGVDLIAGFGNKTSFYGRYSLDAQFLGKICIFPASAGTSEKASLVPEARLTLSRNLLGSSFFFFSFAFDFHAEGFNDDAFVSGARKRTFASWNTGSSVSIYPSIQFGIKF